MFLQNKNNITAIKQLKSSSGLILGVGLGSNIQSEIMIGKGNSYEYLKDSKFGNQEFLNNGLIVDGFGNLSNDIIVDSDFDNRGRLGRVISTLKNNNKKCGIGINEQSAIMIKNNEGYVIGNNGVFIIDTSYANFNKEDKSEFEATNIKLNYLTSGDSINLKTMKVKTSKNEIDLNEDNNIYNSEDIFNSYETTKIITSLAKSNVNVAKGLTKEDDPRFTLLFNKNKDTSSYLENDKLTITNLVLNVTNSVVENIINKPVINAKDQTILLNKEFSLLKGVTAQDKEGNDLTKKIVVTKNTVNTKKLGTYNVCYEVTDSYGQSSTKEIKVEVVEEVEYENEVQNMENKVLKFISTYGYLGIIIAFMMSTFINRWDKMK
ncbi:DUF5011 domain-containing protein [Romboutsia maritimum]|uniref:DUF5011 domain-containing protein n=2 Tax=Romboutsia maritimum TaxID=2020948 RepID=A0A371IUA1_9FIRM|nr:DUF5011 domain-containing protein [Romboutsia maritimum]